MTTYIGKTTTIADSVGAIANVDAIGGPLAHRR